MMLCSIVLFVPSVSVCACIHDRQTIQFLSLTLIFQKRRHQCGFALKTIVKQASAKGYTDLIVINEDAKKPNLMLFIHLPEGPTAYFKLTNVKLGRELKGHGRATQHYPEVITNGFSTRLGKVVSRMFQSLFPQQPEFQGRSVVTFHTQRDFIFVRRHRYVFRSNEKAGLQELGPRFTVRDVCVCEWVWVCCRLCGYFPYFYSFAYLLLLLQLKLMSLQKGTFDSKFGEYEFVAKNKFYVDRKKHYL
eukprot:m.27908 g.27908  ORF g.27908 m.27908 type:complete len:247 (-) comp9409_c0_seq3:707-1447(-)